MEKKKLYEVLLEKTPELEKRKVLIVRLTRTDVDNSPLFDNCNTVEEILRKGLMQVWISRWCDVAKSNKLKECDYLVVCLKQVDGNGSQKKIGTMFGDVYRIESYNGEGDEKIISTKNGHKCEHSYNFGTSEVVECKDLIGKKVDWGTAYRVFMCKFNDESNTMIEV